MFLEEEYTLCYKKMSGLVHGESGALMNQYLSSENGITYLDIGPTHLHG
jgi:hypothetical protein